MSAFALAFPANIFEGASTFNSKIGLGGDLDRSLARQRRSRQGRNGLYFAGQHTTGFDLQEAAVYSAMKVADALAPTSPKLASLRQRPQARGRAGTSCDL